MTDTRLQTLRRAWEASGRTADEAAYLSERVRAAELSRELLQLAAYCGHEAAIAALGDAAPDAPSELRAWAEGLEAWGRDPVLRAGCGLSRLALSRIKDDPGGKRAGRALLLAETWLLTADPAAGLTCALLGHGGRLAEAPEERSELHDVIVQFCGLVAEIVKPIRPGKPSLKVVYASFSRVSELGLAAEARSVAAAHVIAYAVGPPAGP